MCFFLFVLSLFLLLFVLFFFFFFQAEDGIRDDLVTGVQTCALPIWLTLSAPKYAGQDKVNPGSVILSGVLMLEHMGWQDRKSVV